MSMPFGNGRLPIIAIRYSVAMADENALIFVPRAEFEIARAQFSQLRP
jgi:hypothetical protein